MGKGVVSKRAIIAVDGERHQPIFLRVCSFPKNEKSFIEKRERKIKKV
jgi:hypothetical protein